MPNCIYSTLAYCGYLLIVDEEEFTTRFVHQSVKHFVVTSTIPNPRSVRIQDWNIDDHMVPIIFTYLSYSHFETQISCSRTPQVMTGPIPSGVIRATLGKSTGKAATTARRLLGFRKNASCDITNTLAEARKPAAGDIIYPIHSLQYAKAYWAKHTILTNSRAIPHNPLLRLLQGTTLDPNLSDENVYTPLALAANTGNVYLVKLFIDCGRADPDTMNHERQTPLLLAAKYGSNGSTKALLNAKKALANVPDHTGRTPLSWAAGNGHEGVVDILLAVDSLDPQREDNEGHLPLWWAKKEGRCIWPSLRRFEDATSGRSRNRLSAQFLDDIRPSPSSSRATTQMKHTDGWICVSTTAIIRKHS